MKRKDEILDNKNTLSAYNQIKKLIIEKKIQPGEKINQNALAKQLKISRTPIVKALHKLETQGLVDNIPDKGFYVHKLSILEWFDLIVLREALDRIVINEITESITDEQLEKLEEVFNKLKEYSYKNEDDYKMYWKLNQEFHNLIISFSKNNLAKTINEHFQIVNRTFIGVLIRKPSETLSEHSMIMEALRQRDRIKAVEAVVGHMSKSKNYLQEIVFKLKKIGIDPSKIPINEIDFTTNQNTQLKEEINVNTE